VLITPPIEGVRGPTIMKRKIALMAFGSAVAFAAAGLILPPLGVIDGSVLMLSAQLLVLCATLLGVEGYYDKMRDLIKK
jgi:hypothetical protein